MSIAAVYAASSSQWWTRQEWLDWVWDTFFGEDYGELFDPCSRDWKPGDPSGLDIDWKENGYINRPGGKGHSGQEWWEKAMLEMRMKRCTRQIHCFFNDENRLTLTPSPLTLPGWTISPLKREPFIWGGADQFKPNCGNILKPTPDMYKRRHGELQKSPSNHTIFWSTVRPATPPVPCIIERTGAAYIMGRAA